GVTLGHVVPRVPQLLAAAQAALELDAVDIEVETQRHQCEPVLHVVAVEVFDLSPVEQQPPPAIGFVVGPVALLVGADMDLEQPGLASLDANVAVAQLGATGAQRLDLGAEEFDPGLEGLEHLVFVERVPVASERRIARLSSGRWRHWCQASDPPTRTRRPRRYAAASIGRRPGG